MKTIAFVEGMCDSGAQERGCSFAGFTSRFVLAVGFLLAIVTIRPACSFAAVNVFLDSTASLTLQDEFIRSATNQYNGVLVKSPYNPNTYTFTISSKKPVGVPPPPPPAVAIPCTLDESLVEMRAIAQETFPYAVSNGMDVERSANVQQIYGLQSLDAVNKTCGGVPVSILTSSTTILSACVQTYNVVASSISERWGYVFTPDGKRVIP